MNTLTNIKPNEPSEEVLHSRSSPLHTMETTEHATQSLIEGLWFAESTALPSGSVFNCCICCCYFSDRISYEIHLRGIKHKMMRRSDVSSPSSQNNYSTKHLSHLETLLLEEHNPVLGVNYLTEYFHACGFYECSCNLCGKIFDSVPSAKHHIVSSDHMLNFMFHWDNEMFENLRFKTQNQNFFLSQATNLQTATNEKDKRTKIMEELGSVWVEFQHEGNDSNRIQRGHQFNLEYEVSTCTTSQMPATFDEFLNKFSKLFVLSNNLPPSYQIEHFNRTQFLELLSKFEIRNDKDVDSCLQLVNFLTLGFLKYRMNLVRNMKFVDTSTIRAKLNFLIGEAETVAEKLLNKSN